MLQVEFPTLGLANCPGDSEGVNEMNESAALLRQLCAVFERAGTAEGVRIFFPGACRVASLPQRVTPSAPDDGSGKGRYLLGSCCVAAGPARLREMERDGSTCAQTRRSAMWRWRTCPA